MSEVKFSSLLCNCGTRVVIHTSWTNYNPGRTRVVIHTPQVACWWRHSPPPQKYYSSSGLPYDNHNVVQATGFYKTLADSSPTSAAQQFISTDGVRNHRRRVLGGGSAINTGFYSHASADYVNQVGWESRLVNASYEWVERKVVF